MNGTSCTEAGPTGVGLVPAPARPEAVIENGSQNDDAANFVEWFQKDWLILWQVLKQPC
jgi:hypothetical protein